MKEANEITYVAQNLRRHRESRGYSTYDLADRSGVSRLTISAIENKRTSNMKLSTVARLGSALGLAGWMLCVPPEHNQVA